MHIFSRALKHLLVTTGLALLIVPCASAGNYRIAPGPLEQALLEFSRQSGVQLVFASALVNGKYTRGLTATNADTTTALAILLRDSNLRAEPIDSNAFVVKPFPPPKKPFHVAPQPLPAIPLASQLPIELAEVRANALLPRTETETFQPITVIDRQRIEASGFQTLYELLRAQPGIRVDNAPVATSDSQTYLNNGLSGATGAASVSLHGLGASATPVLVDGQRLGSYGLAQGQFSTVGDLNSIPLALIERVEILRDGASVIYGADAMAGAVNIILRRQFEGAGISASTGSSTHGDARQNRVSGTFGDAWLNGTGHLLFSFDYLHREPLLNRQRAWTRAKADSDTDGFFYVNGAAFSYAGRLCRVFHADDACASDPDGPATLQTGLVSRSVLAHVDRPLGTATLYGDLRWTALDQRQQGPPSTLAGYIYGFDAASGRARTYSFEDVGPVVDRAASRILQLTLGMRGNAAEWDWDVRLDGQRNRGTDRIHGLIRDSELWNGPYRFSYDHNLPAVLEALSPTLVRRGQASRLGISGRLEGVLTQNPHGDVTLAAGLEAYREQLADRPDPLLLSGDIYQIQPPSNRRDDRWNTAIYAELRVPLMSRLSTSTGLRLEHSDGYHTAASPHLGLKWDVSGWISLRGSWAMGYRAPPLLSLSQPSAVMGSAQYFSLPASVLPCQSGIDAAPGTALCALRLNSSSNPHLRPERSRSFAAGIVLAPTNRLSMTLDAYQLDRYHEIGALPIDYAINHPDSFPLIYVRDADGALYALQQQTVNLGQTRLRTVDMNARYLWQTARHGTLSFDLGVNWLVQLKRRLRAGDGWTTFAGNAHQPRITALAAIGWQQSDWSLGATLRYTGHYAYAPYQPYAAFTTAASNCSTGMSTGHCRTPAFTLVDVNLNYTGWAPWTFGFNVHNLFDHKPEFYSDSSLTYSPTFDDVVGRYVQFSVRYRY